MRRVLFLAVFSAACAKTEGLDCPNGSRSVGGQCLIECSRSEDCLSSERCDPTERVCMPGGGGGTDASVKDAFEDEDSGPKDRNMGRDREITDQPVFPDVEPRDFGFDDRGFAEDARTPDAGFPDAPASDANETPNDTGFRDAERDAGFEDATPPDLGTPDSGGYGVAIMRNAGVDLYQMTPGVRTTLIRSIPTTASRGDPTWSPNAGSLAFETAVTGPNGDLVEQVEIYRATGVFVDSFPSAEPNWSRDLGGTRIVAAMPRNLVVHPTTGGLVVTYSEPEPEHPLWDPSGALRFAFYASPAMQRELFVRDLLSNRFRVAFSVSAYAWSPDGLQIVNLHPATNGCSLFSARIGTTSVLSSTPWVTDLPCEGVRLAWSRGGSLLALSLRPAAGAVSGAIYLIQTAGPFPISLSNVTPWRSVVGEIVDLEWTPDDRYLAHGRLDTASTFVIELDPLDTSEPTSVFGPELGPGFFALRPVN
jgi:hypothetical protein